MVITLSSRNHCFRVLRGQWINFTADIHTSDIFYPLLFLVWGSHQRALRGCFLTELKDNSRLGLRRPYVMLKVEASWQVSSPAGLPFLSWLCARYVLYLRYWPCSPTFRFSEKLTLSIFTVSLRNPTVKKLDWLYLHLNFLVVFSFLINSTSKWMLLWQARYKLIPKSHISVSSYFFFFFFKFHKYEKCRSNQRGPLNYLTLQKVKSYFGGEFFPPTF